MKQIIKSRRNEHGIGKKRTTDTFIERIKPGALLQTIKDNSIVCVWYALVLLVLVFCMSMFFLTERPARYTLGAVSEIDFSDPDIHVHTAGDGIAVVGTMNYRSIAPNIVPTSNGTRITNDPSAIWQGDNSHTHGGFTLPVQMDGESIGILAIPDIGVSVRVYESESEMEAMTKGAAHFKMTSSWDGNVGVSAHNVNLDGTAGYFLNLHKLRQGAAIRYETALGKREYKVESIREISEMDWSMLYRTQDNRITLVTCITGKPNMRLVIQAVEKS